MLRTQTFRRFANPSTWETSMRANVRVLMAIGLLVPFAQVVRAQSPPLPSQINQCERSILKVCGIWARNGEQYTATWSNGAKATVTVTTFDGHAIALHRVDTPDSITAGM